MWAWVNRQNAFLGLLLGFLGLAFPVYQEYFKIQTEITLTHSASVNAFAINKGAETLKISFDGEPVDPNTTAITWDRFSIENSGNTHITQNLFDHDESWGIEVTNGSIINTTPIATDDPYLQSKVRSSISNGRINFPNFIFEKGKKFSFEVVVKHSPQNEPHYAFFGKIAGAEFKYDDRRGNEGKEGTLRQAFAGPFSVQLFRTVIYFLLAVVLVICVVFATFLVNSALLFISRPYRRGKFRKQVTRVDLIYSEDSLKVLEKIYVEGGAERIKRLLSHVDNKDRVFLKKGKLSREHAVPAGDLELDEGEIVRLAISEGPELRDDLEKLNNVGLLVSSEEDVKFSAGIRELVLKLLDKS
ncbi:MAG TPA: hypothetical protein VEF76_11530 [Patescibacteria group bacterium]|nr:hypothetical protein [Patescibacteria group bacterium]